MAARKRLAPRVAVYICQRKFVTYDICKCKWVVRSFAHSFLGAFILPIQVIEPFLAISLLLTAF